MRDTIRTIRNFGIYLLPASLLAAAGVLLMALLYYPVPAAAPSSASHAAAIVDHEYWRSHAEALFAAMVADALRQLQEEQEGQARTLQYRYERPLPSGERPATPLGPNSGAADRPPLIRL